MAGLVLLWSVPLPATPTTETVTPSVETVSQEMTGFGAWMTRLQEIVRPLQVELAGLRGAWQEATRGGARDGVAGFRDYVRRVEAAIDGADAGLRALDTPAFAALDLAEDLRPASVVRDMLRVNQETRVLVRNFLPLLDSISGNDPRAMQAATGELMRSVGVVLDSQIVFARAAIVSTEREEAAWEAGHIQLLFFRAMQRALNAWPNAMRGTADESLDDDFEQMARELDGHAQTGSAKNQAAIARLGGEARGLAEEGDEPRAQIIRRVAAIYAVSENYFGLGRDIATALRESAQIARRRPFTIDALGEVMTAISRWRPRFDEIAQQESAIMARGD